MRFLVCALSAGGFLDGNLETTVLVTCFCKIDAGR